MADGLFTRWLGVDRRRRWLRVALSHYVLNGASCALGLFLVSGVMRGAFGAEASAVATVGVIAALAADVVGPRRGKLAHMVVEPLIGVPLFWAVQRLHGHPVELGLLLVPATFVVFLGMAWGKRGTPVAIGVMLAAVFSMSTPVAASPEEALVRTAYCGIGSMLYVVYSVLANLVLNGRYRTQLMADLLLAVAALLRAHARRVAAAPGEGPEAQSAPGAPVYAPGGLGELLKRQAALADQLQSTRDVVLESPRTARRQRLAGMLMVVLEMRDHLVASELDLDRVRHAAQDTRALDDIAAIYRDMAADVEQLADDLLLRRPPAVAADHTRLLAGLHLAEQAPAAADADTRTRDTLLRGVAYRVRHQNDAVRQLTLLARGEVEPDLAVVRNSWRLFVSPTDWSLQPFLNLWHWHQPALRQAVRAALAIGTGYTIASLLPWGSHDYWILLTIVVVLRGSLAQTLERRNQRVAGTLLGSLLATGFLGLHPSVLLMVLAVTIGQGVAHGFALRRYTVTAVAASIMGLVQAHMLFAANSTAFAFVERVADTVLGAGIAWAFSYVLPSWERGQLPALLRRVLRALEQHARLSLALAHLDDIDTEHELMWRLARREAYDAVSALVQATGRSLVEPRAVRPPLALLEQLQGHSYQLMGQLSAVKSMLLLRREQLQFDQISEPIKLASACIQGILTLTAPLPPGTGRPATPDNSAVEAALPAVPEALPDPFEQDVSPWLLRRLHLSIELAERVRGNAQDVLAALASTSAPAHRPNPLPPATPTP